MLMTSDEPRTTGERYISADSVVIRTAEHEHSKGEILVAAGAVMVRRTPKGQPPETLDLHRRRTADLAFGEALLKLRGEFDGAVRLRAMMEVRKPPLPIPPILPRQPGETLDNFTNRETPYLDAVEARERVMKADKEEVHRQNYSERLQMLNGLPSFFPVKDRCTAWLKEKNHSQSVAEGVIRFWLDPLCIGCNGRRWATAAGTGRLSGQACTLCTERDSPRASGMPTGQRRFPSGDGAARLYDHMQRAAGEFPPAAQRKMR